VTTNVFPSRPARVRPFSPGAALRLLWIEIKRNAMPWALPLLTVLFFYDTYRTASGYPPVWTVRALLVTSKMVFDFAAFAGGLAAWTGSREGRRRTGDLLAQTVRHALTRQLAALGATLLWVLAAFLAAVAALYVQTARAVTWGGPPLWPIFVGVTAVTMLSVLGFVAGALFPGRFTAPLVAICAGLLPIIGSHNLQAPTGNTHVLLTLNVSLQPYDWGVFYHVLPDVSIAQVMFMGGIAVAAIGLLALAPVLRLPVGSSAGGSAGSAAAAGMGWWLCVTSAVVLVAGVAASGTAYYLVGTAKQTRIGWEIPALHDAASDRPVPYTPDCKSVTGFQVCMHPAFSGYLDGAAAALGPVGAEIAGLPGAPMRASQVAEPLGPPYSPMGITGTPPVYHFAADITWMSTAAVSGSGDHASLQESFLDSFVGGPSYAETGNLDPVEQTVVSALMIAIGTSPQAAQFGGPTGPSASGVPAAASRFAALPASTRHAWLLTHLAALRAGHVTLAELP
jgi:hypothetical protein